MTDFESWTASLDFTVLQRVKRMTFQNEVVDQNAAMVPPCVIMDSVNASSF